MRIRIQDPENVYMDPDLDPIPNPDLDPIPDPDPGKILSVINFKNLMLPYFHFCC